MQSDGKKLFSFVALLFAGGDLRRYSNVQSLIYLKIRITTLDHSQ